MKNVWRPDYCCTHKPISVCLFSSENRILKHSWMHSLTNWDESNTDHPLRQLIITVKLFWNFYNQSLVPYNYSNINNILNIHPSSEPFWFTELLKQTWLLLGTGGYTLNSWPVCCRTSHPCTYSHIYTMRTIWRHQSTYAVCFLTVEGACKISEKTTACIGRTYKLHA